MKNKVIRIVIDERLQQATIDGIVTAIAETLEGLSFAIFIDEEECKDVQDEQL